MCNVTTFHKGQMLRHKTETSWPTIILASVHENPTATFGGKNLAPFAWGVWQDGGGSSAFNLATLEKDWEDTGV
jgi:hypothetical protein